MSSNGDRQAITLDEATDDEDNGQSEQEVYEEKIEEIQEAAEERHEHLEGMPNPAAEIDGPEAPDDVRDIEGENISVSTPDWLSEEEVGTTPSPPGNRTPPGSPSFGDINLGELESILSQIEGSVGNVGLDDVGDIGFDDANINIDDILSGIDLSQVSPGEAAIIRLLSAMLQLHANEFQVLKIMSRLQLATSVGISDMLSAVSPVSDITVSGSNVISTASAVEPVVPQSDTENIPTKLLFLKADARNTDAIAIGDDQISPSAGYILKRGDDIMIEADLRGEEFYMSSSQANQTIHILGMI